MFKFTGLLAILAVSGASGQSFVGEKEPIENQTCISIRLPWQEAPIFFCTENENIHYKARCSNYLARYCPSENSPKTLQIATPWDCCGLVSTPDYCADVSCPAAPFNRSCIEIPADSKSRWDCCPTYFCENGTTSSCPMKRLQPGCTSPPKDKTGCVAFKDQHGCCNKFQCAGEGKSGMCPMEAQAMDFKDMMEKLTNRTSKMLAAGNSSSPMDHFGHFGRIGGRSLRNNLISTEVQCVGDHTCPGQMKCCSMHMSSYYEFNKENSGLFGMERAINGYCMEPVQDESELIAG